MSTADSEVKGEGLVHNWGQKKVRCNIDIVGLESLLGMQDEELLNCPVAST